MSAVRRLPELPGWPGLGQLIAFRRDPLAVLRALSSLPGRLWQLRLGPRRIVVGSAPEVAEALLVRLAPSMEKGPLVRRWSRPLLGDGLISCATDAHAEHRAQLAPVMGWLRSEAWLERLAERCACALAGRSGPVVAGGGEPARLVAEALGPALIGEGAPTAAILDGIERVQRYLVARIRNPLLPPIGAPTPRARRAAAALRSLERAVEAALRARAIGRSAQQADRQPGVSGAVGDRDPQADGQPGVAGAVGDRDLAGGGELLDRLRGLGDGGRVRDELITLVVAALETTGAALGWTLALVAAHPEVQARVREEVRAVLGGRRAPAAQDLPALALCDQVIKESLRLWPPVHTLGRQVRAEVDLLGTPLPPGTIVAFSTWLLHRRPDLYPDPEAFRPERFARGSAGPGRYAYLPFGAGPRACLGGEPALATLKLLLAGIVARDQLPAPAPVRPEMLVTLRPCGAG